MEEYGLDLFQKYMRDLYIYVLETSEEILFEARQNNFLRLSTWSADNLSPLEGQLVMTGRHGRPQTPWTQTGSSFPGTHGKPSGGTRPKYSKQALFLAKLKHHNHCHNVCPVALISSLKIYLRKTQGAFLKSICLLNSYGTPTLC